MKSLMIEMSTSVFQWLKLRASQNNSTMEDEAFLALDEMRRKQAETAAIEPVKKRKVDNPCTPGKP